MRATPLLLCLLLLASPAAAQEYLAVGETVHGELTSDDLTLDDGEHYDEWMFPALEGATYLITLRSEDFDAYLFAGPSAGGGCDPCEEDDDGDLGTDAQLSVEAPEAGYFIIRVTSFEPGETGRYTLEVLEESPPSSIPLVVPGTDTVVAEPEPPYLVLNADIAGWLTDQDEIAADGAYEDTWILRAIPGEPVTITMRSDDFDTVLRVGWWAQGRWEELAYDDDGGDGTNSELTFIAPRDDEYLVLASSFDEGEEGAYTLRAGPPYGTDSVLVTPELYADQPAEGALEEGDRMQEDGELMDVWEYFGREGETITVQMASDAFDTYLYVRMVDDDGMWVVLAADDDGGSGTDSELTLTLPRDGTYAIHAAALEAGAGGEYTLVVRRH